MTINVNTLKLAIQLEAGGFTTEQARALASALGEAAQVADLVTNADLDRFEQKINARFTDLEQRLVIRLGGLAVVLTGLALAVMHYLPPHQ